MRHQSEAECVIYPNPLSQSPECQQEALEKPESGESSSWYVFKHDWVPPGVYVGDSLWMDVSA